MSNPNYVSFRYGMKFDEIKVKHLYFENQLYALDLNELVQQKKEIHEDITVHE